ncbi:hypothetical protein ANN_17694 [Periplaneta americana]|uniref:Uncharacterized protein n=1 Tax=Periplaneta americana TaxID=6978 RepID=A0ABQ8STP3_PERAM|nr:hypothetical protein ANN_17694 [Periplaneta americana]
MDVGCRSREEEVMQVTDKNLAVFPDVCASKLCRSSCVSPDCQLCKPCLTPETVDVLKDAYMEHINRQDCKRIFPPHMPTSHLEDCYFCITKKPQGFSRNTKDIIVYPNLPPAIRPVPHSPELPAPIPPPKSQSKQASRSSTRVCVRICVSIRRPEFECSGPQLEGPEFECSGPQLEGPEFEYSELSLKVCGSRYRELE